MSNELPLTTPTTEQIKQLILDNPQFGISGHSNWNWADWYSCSGCYADTTTKGHASIGGTYDDIDHKPDCPLMQLRAWAEAKND